MKYFIFIILVTKNCCCSSTTVNRDLRNPDLLTDSVLTMMADSQCVVTYSCNRPAVLMIIMITVQSQLAVYDLNCYYVYNVIRHYCNAVFRVLMVKILVQ